MRTIPPLMRAKAVVQSKRKVYIEFLVNMFMVPASPTARSATLIMDFIAARRRLDGAARRCGCELRGV